MYYHYTILATFNGIVPIPLAESGILETVFAEFCKQFRDVFVSVFAPTLQGCASNKMGRSNHSAVEPHSRIPIMFINISSTIVGEMLMN